MSSFTGALVTRHENGELFVEQYFEFHIFTPESNLFVPVNRGFETNLASIPWFLQWASPKIGKHDRPAVVHDKMYADPVLVSRTPTGVIQNKISRIACDYIFYQALLADGVNDYKAIPMWMAVRCFGWIWFDKNSEK